MRKIPLTEIVVDGSTVLAKPCFSCRIVKPLTDYRKHKSGPGGHDSRCKACSDKYLKEYRSLNKDMTRERRKRYRKKHRDQKLAEDARYRARKMLLPNTWTEEDEAELLTLFENKCSLSGDICATFDHFISLSTGHGGTYKGNIIILSNYLNASKGSKNPFEWVKDNDNVDTDSFNKLVYYLAFINGLNVEQYKQFVYWCYENKRSINEMKTDNRYSINIWKEKEATE